VTHLVERALDLCNLLLCRLALHLALGRLEQVDNDDHARDSDIEQRDPPLFEEPGDANVVRHHAQTCARGANALLL
jgi:hypothetical protein